MSAYKSPPEDNLRNEITEILNKITDSETLLFCLWMFKKITNHEELPPPEKLKNLRDAFIQMIERMSNEELLAYATTGKLPDWFPKAEKV